MDRGPGFFSIGVYNLQKEVNLGTLWRSAFAFGASSIFTIGRKYTHQSSDTCNAIKHIPLYHYKNKDEFLGCGVPRNTRLVGVELIEGAFSLPKFDHPGEAMYILGPENGNLPKDIIERCDAGVVVIPSSYCLNVSVAGSIVLYDRLCKLEIK